MARNNKHSASVAAAVSVTVFSFGGLAQAAPSGFELKAGDSRISIDNLTTTITQSTDKAVVNWNDFSIASNEVVKFIQNNPSSVALNRVTGTESSKIHGALTANGNIFLINPNGILFGANAQVDVAGLLASTFDIDPDEFMSGDMKLTGDMMSAASIKNEGTLKIGEGGFVYLIAPNVENSGHIIANVGRVTLANDGAYQVDLSGNGLIKFEVDASTLSGTTGTTTSVKNSGRIDGGDDNGSPHSAQNVLLSGSQVDGVVSSVVNTGDVVAASELTLAGDSVDQSGTVVAATATLTASGDITSSGGSLQAGAINLTTGGSAKVVLDEGSSLYASIDFGGQNQTLSTTGNVTSDLAFTHTAGGVTLDGAHVDADLSVTAAGAIVGAGSAEANGDASAKRLALTTTIESAGIGAEGTAMRVAADMLSATADKGHIVVTDVAGDLALERVTTGDSSAEAGLRALITAEDGKLSGAQNTQTGTASPSPNVEAWATHLQADGAIGSGSQPLTTSVQVLSATTQDGDIHIANTGGDLVLNRVSAGERITLNGSTVSSSAISDADGDITLSNGATGSRDLSIASDQDVLITNAVTATDALTLSAGGSLLQAGNNAQLTGRELDLTAGGAVGQTATGALRTQSNTINAQASDGGVYLREGVGLHIGTLSGAVSTNSDQANNVELSAGQGDIRLGQVDAAGGAVKVTAGQGSIAADGAGTHVTADSLALEAKSGIGSSATSLATDVSELTTTNSANLAGTYVDNQGALNKLDVTTRDGDVVIGTGPNANVSFSGSSDTLSTSQNTGFETFAFDNTAGGIDLEGGLSATSTSLTATGAITGQNGTLTGNRLTLSAGTGIDLTTAVGKLDATATDGDITINNGTHTAGLTATARADDGDFTLTTGGDLAVAGIKASDKVSLSAGGAITGTAEGTDVEAARLLLQGNGIGSTADAFTTRVSERLSAQAGTGGLFLANVGSLSLLGGEAGGNIDLSVSGDAILDTLEANGSITFSATGRVSDGNGDALNLSGDTLTLSAQQIGARDGSIDALEVKVDELVLDTRSGGIFVRNLNNSSLALTRAKAAGGDIAIDSAGNMALNSVSAAGNQVTLNSGGAITDGRPTGSSDANVQAKTLSMQAEYGVGTTQAPLALEVDSLSVGGGRGAVNAANLSSVAVDRASLDGKTAGVTIVATGITILDDQGGVITLKGGSLTLTATNGNIVFLNQNDTIRLEGGGAITLTAKADPDRQGYHGNIITGNLTTQGGDITLDADANVTLGMLDTGGSGDVTVTARNGVILDGNGADANIRGDQVTLKANTPSLNDAEINRETAIAEYSARIAELESNTLQLKNLQQQLEAHIAALESAIVARGIATTQQSSVQREVDRLSRDVSIAVAISDSLNLALNVAQIARNTLAIVSGAAQAIPFSGDAGADAAFAVADLAFSVAQTALDGYDRSTLKPLEGRLNDREIDLATLKANTVTAETSVNNWATLRDTTRVSVDTTTQAVFKSTVARDASLALRRQALDAYKQNQDINMAVEKPLGITANRLDMGTLDGRALNSGVYLDSPGSLGLGDIAADGEIRVDNVAGDIRVVGTVKSPSLISLDADAGIRDGAGVLEAAEVALRAGTGIGNAALQTRTGRIAAQGGSGAVTIHNDGNGQPLAVGSVDGISGLQADGDITLMNQGDLRLEAAIADTDTDSANRVTLTATGGDIADNNADATNVTAAELRFSAGGSVELDTQMGRLVEGDSLTQGDITLRNDRNLVIDTLETQDGDLLVDAGGRLRLSTLSAGNQGDITLSAQGNIDDDGDNSTRLSGNTLTLTATGGAIGASGHNTTRALDTSVASVTAGATGDVNLAESDALDVISVATAGDVTLTSQSGSLRVGEVESTGTDTTITLEAAVTIEALNEADATPELKTDRLALLAGNGIGKAEQALLTETAALEADAGSGGLYLHNQVRDLTVGGVTPNLGLASLNGLAAEGDLKLSVTDGSLTIDEAVTQSGSGDTELFSQGAMSVNAVLQASGNLELKTADDLTINGQQLTAQGAMDLDAGKDVSVTDGTLEAKTDLSAAAKAGDLALTRSTLTSQTGAMDLDAGKDVSVTDGTLEAKADLSATAKGADLALTQSTLTAQGGAMDLDAGNGVMTTDSTLKAGTDLSVDAAVDRIALNSSQLTAGSNLSLTAATDIALTRSEATNATGSKLTAQGGDLALTAGGSVALDSAASGLASGNVTANAKAGDLTLAQNSALTAQGGAMDLDANKDVSVTDGTLEAKTDLSATAQGGDLALTRSTLISQTGAMDLDAGNGITLTDGTLTAGSALSATAQAGDLALTRSILTAQNGAMDLDAGRDIIVTDMTAQNGLQLRILPPSQASTLTAQNGVMDLDAGRDITITDSTVTAQDGAQVRALLTSQASTVAAPAGTMDLDAGNGVTVTDSTLKAARDLSVDAALDRIALNNSQLTAGSNLSLTAETDIALTDSEAANATGSTIAAKGGDLTLAAGGSVALDSAASGLASGNVTANAKAGDLTLTQNSALTAQGGMMDLDAGNGVTVTDGTLTAGSDLSVDAAVTRIALNNSQLTAGSNLSLTAETDIALTDSEAADATGSTLDAQGGELALAAGGSIALDSAASGLASGNVTANAKAGDLTLAQDSTLTAQGGAMDLDAGNGVMTTDSTLKAGTDLSVDAAVDRIALNSSQLTAGSNLSLTAATDIALTRSEATNATGSKLTAQGGDLALTAVGSVALDSAASGLASGNVTANAKAGDLTLAQNSALTAQGGAMDLDAGKDVSVTDGTLEAKTDLSVTAKVGDLGLTRSTLTAQNGAMDLDAGNKITVTRSALTAQNGAQTRTLATSQGSTLIAQAGVMDLDAGNSVTVADSKLTASQGMTLDAGGDIGFANGTATAGSDLAITTTGGAITQTGTSQVSAGSDLAMTAEETITLTRVRAGNEAALTSRSGAVVADAKVQEHVSGNSLVLNAAKNIGSALSSLKTRISKLSASIRGSGDLTVDEVDELTVKSVSLADGNATLTTGGDLSVERLTAKGDVGITSGGAIRTTEEGRISANELNATAKNDIDLTSTLQAASLVVTDEGGIDVVNNGALRLGGASTFEGDIDISAGGNLRVGEIATKGPGAVTLASSGAMDAAEKSRINAGRVDLTAVDGIGAIDALSLATERLTADTSQGDIRFDQAGNVALDRLRTGKGNMSVAVTGGDATLGDIRTDGDIRLSAVDGVLRDDGSDSTVVSGNTLALTSATGIGVDRALDTRASRISAMVTGVGDIRIAERAGLVGLSASATDGDVQVSTVTGDLGIDQVATLTPGRAVMLTAKGGAILDANGEANNIVTRLLEMVAARGIGRAADPLEVKVDTVTANGGAGGVYLENTGTGPLKVAGLNGRGPVSLSTGGDLELTSGVSGGGVDLRAAGDLLQSANITSSAGVDLYGQGDVTMAKNTRTLAADGVMYRADERLTVDTITAAGGLVGGRIILQGESLRSNADNPGSLKGGDIRFDLSDTRGLNVGTLVANPDSLGRISLNGRTVGGKIIEDSQYTADMAISPADLSVKFDPEWMVPMDPVVRSINDSSDEQQLPLSQ